MSIAGAGNPSAVRAVESLLNMLEKLQNVLIATKLTRLQFWVLEASQLKLSFFNLLSLFSVYTTVEASIQEISMTEELMNYPIAALSSKCTSKFMNPRLYRNKENLELKSCQLVWSLTLGLSFPSFALKPPPQN